MRVLVAEDDPGLRSIIDRGLQEQGYMVDAVSDGTQALQFLKTYEYEVVVLDWRMPGATGIDVIRQARQNGNTVPILMLTARDTSADRVAGLDQGADDYLVKPFDFPELLARLRALQRRSPALQSTCLAIGDLVLEPATREVSVGTKILRLTNIELGILELLMRRSPQVVSRRSIALHAWPEEADALGSNTIDVHLARLRAKLVSGGVSIETMRGVGYRIIPG